MVDKELRFSTEREIQNWANSTFIRKVDGSIVQVQHFQNKMYYFFTKKFGMWELAMSSTQPIREENV